MRDLAGSYPRLMVADSTLVGNTCLKQCTGSVNDILLEV